MTLSFSQKWDKRMGNLAGKPNYFVENIWEGLTINKLIPEKEFDSWYDKVEGFGINLNVQCQPKHHTIREDKLNRWREGMDIHFVINNRTKNRFQFAPVVKCVSVQKIEIEYVVKNQFDVHGELSSFSRTPILIIGNRHFYNPLLDIDEGMEELAINDGFPSLDAFFQYFNYDFQGKIIHWTDLKY